MSRHLLRALPVLVLASCLDAPAPDTGALAPTRLSVDRTYLRDGHGRYVQFHGINVSGSTKAPTFDGSGVPEYLVEPFPDDQAEAELAKLRGMGFNVIRLLLQWEAIQPDDPGVTDTAYLAHVRHVVETADRLGIYVLMDMHQDMFSRHLLVRYNNNPDGDVGTVEHSLLALVEPYNDEVKGDGAPRWAVAACLQEKEMGSAHWGTPRVLSGLDEAGVTDIYRLYQRLVGKGDETGDPLPDWLAQFVLGLRPAFPVNETSDMLPFTQWGLAHALSLDLARCYACFFAGKAVFPTLQAGGTNVQDYLQGAYAAAWGEAAAAVADLPNVIGYDIINEPSGNFLVLSAAAALIRSGVIEDVRAVLVSFLGEETGGDLYDALVVLRVLPPDTTPATLALWGLDKLDVAAALGLNGGFSETYGHPFYERVGEAILARDPDAVLFIEDMMSASTLSGNPAGGIGGIYENPMTRPGLSVPDRVVFAPHWYPDIYPEFGFVSPPRAFTLEEVSTRDYVPKLEDAAYLADYSLGHIPVVYGEYGSYFNFNGIQASIDSGYEITGAILNNYLEAFERLNASRILWCYSYRNDPFYGDFWNHEDFSAFGPDGEPRGELAWSRPHAMALAGKPVATRFNSDFHTYDPDPGVPIPWREFSLVYGTRETSAPSEIYVPAAQYPDGFYVWVSDGSVSFVPYADGPAPRGGVLYHRPDRDEPGTEHWVILRPPQAGAPRQGYAAFYRFDGRAVGGGL